MSSGTDSRCYCATRESGVPGSASQADGSVMDWRSRPFLTIQEAAAVLSVHYNTIHKRIAGKAFKAFKEGSIIRIDGASFRQYVDARMH